MIQYSEWLEGPSFLLDEKEKWPVWKKHLETSETKNEKTKQEFSFLTINFGTFKKLLQLKTVSR